MGVHSFWEIVGPTARPVKLESLQDKKMAVDASIWIYQFLKAMRDSDGNAIKNSHITGFFRRICKLLYFGIKPVFIFDGGVPALKKDTIKLRNEIRQGKRDSAKRTARKLLALQLHKESQNTSTSKKIKEEIPQNNEIIFRPQDDWDLPNIEGFRVRKDDERINMDFDTEKTKKKKLYSTIEEIIDNMDLDSIDPTSKEFEELPNNIKYQILSSLRLKSRLRMGYTKDQLENIFPDSIDFSKFQIDMVKRRNFYTQRIINMTGYHDGGASNLNDEVINRISGQRDREYRISKTDNGWALGLGVNDGSEVKKAIILDGRPSINDNDYSNKINDKGSDEDEDDEWEDVDLKPQQIKDTFDYSLKAGRLPQLENTSKFVGSQAFLDKRPMQESPVKQPQKNTFFKVEPQKIDDDDESDDIEDNDYLQQIDEIEMMEACQKSKLEQFQREKIEKENEEKKEIIHKQNNMIQQANKKQKEVQKNIESTNEVILTENEQNLTFVVGKIPEVNFSGTQSFLFDEANIEVTLNGKSQDDDKRVVPETPAWFQSNSEAKNSNEIENPFASTAFVQDKEYNDTNNYETNTTTFQLLSGMNAQELIEREANKYEGINNGISDKDDNVDVISISNLSSEEEKETITAKDHSITNVIEEEIEPTVSEEMHRQTPEETETATNSTKPMVFDYEFSEDEENDLVENIRQEKEDFNKFRSDAFTKEYKKDVADSAFLEDDLFKQHVKDKRDADEVSQDMVIDIQQLLSHFGIPFITSPMEAEAQCAELLKLSLVDGVITDDSDVFLFGGTKIYKNIFHDRKYVEYYNSETILKDLGIDRNNMIELALLLGSDYTTGIKGMGPVSSMEIVAEFGDLESFKVWYEEGQFDKEKQNQESKFEKDLRKKLVKNEIILDQTFPSELVVDAYTNPEVDHDKTPFKWGNPELDMLRTFMEDHLGWPQEKSDDILIPLIRDINNKKQNKQKTLNEFFPTEFIQDTSRKINVGKRITSAASKLKKRRLK